MLSQSTEQPETMSHIPIPSSSISIRRRAFMQHVDAAGAVSPLAPSGVFSSSPQASPNERVNLACCGIGHRGADDVRSLHDTGLATIVAICDTGTGASHTQELIAQRVHAKLAFHPTTEQITAQQAANDLLGGVPPRNGWAEFYRM